MAVIVNRQPQPNLGKSTTDQEPDSIATPRALVPHAVVVAAVVSLPTLSPVLPASSHESEYTLSSNKRKADDGDLAPEGDENEPLRPAKKSKTATDQDPFYGPVETLPLQENVFDIPLQQAISAALYTEPVAESVATPPSVLAPVATAELLEYPTPAGSPLAASSLLEVLNDQGSDVWKSSAAPDAFYNTAPSPVFNDPTIPPPQIAQCIDILDLPEAPSRSPTIIPRELRNKWFSIEKPIWVQIQKSRTDQIVAHFGIEAVRATVEQEVALRHRRAMRPSPLKNSSAPASEDLRLAIYTPSTIADGTMDVEEDLEATESEIEDAADMSFDLDEEDDSESYEDEDGADTSVDLNSIPTAEHETIMDVTPLEPIAVAAVYDHSVRAGMPVADYAPALSSMIPMTITICSDPPPLPRLATVRADDVLRQWYHFELPGLGTPKRNPPRNCGPLNRDYLRSQAQLDRAVWRF